MEDIYFDDLQYDEANDYYHATGNGYHCYSHDMEVRGRFYVLVGNTKSAEKEYKKNKKDFIKENFENLKNLAIATDRAFCIHDLSEESLELISNSQALEFLVIIGHGTKGLLETKPSNESKSKSIPADAFPVLVSDSLVMVDFIYCQAGTQKEKWRSKFPEHTIMHIKDEDVSISQAQNYLNSELLKAFAIASNDIDCDKLNENNKGIVDYLKIDNRCRKTE